MNSRQLQYAIELAQIRNFSQLAEKLNISQPALSKQIQSLENEIGIKLFDRNSSPLELTPAGAYFIKQAQELLYKEDQLKRTMESFKSGEVGRLVIGVTPFRSIYLMPKIVKKIKSKYPGVQVVLHETGSDQLRKEAAEGKYDFALVNLPVNDSVLDIIPIEPDTLVLAVPNEMANNIPSVQKGEYAEIDFKDCGELPFIVVGETQEMRQLFDKLCASADLHPNITAEVVGVATAWAMARTGVGATLLPLQFVKGERFDNNLTLFTLKNKTYKRQPVIVTKRGQYISEYAKYAIKLLTE